MTERASVKERIGEGGEETPLQICRAAAVDRVLAENEVRRDDDDAVRKGRSAWGGTSGREVILKLP